MSTIIIITPPVKNPTSEPAAHPQTVVTGQYMTPQQIAEVLRAAADATESN